MLTLDTIYQPIKVEMADVDALLEDLFKDANNNSLSRLNRFLLTSRGKKIRPALVIFSAKTVLSTSSFSNRCTTPLSIKDKLNRIATAVELIHMASLVHDDIIDHSDVRHNRATINSRWGDDVSIAFGDYIFARAFELISECENPDIIRCLSSATKSMCEGELLQVCERDNLDLMKQRYIIIVKKKTAMFFGASCEAGALICGGERNLQRALMEYGLNLGIAFQIVDDYLDLIGDEKKLGKSLGQDINVGEVTLPILNLLDIASPAEKRKLKALISSFRNDGRALQEIRSMIYDSGAGLKTRQQALYYITLAKDKIDKLPLSSYKQSLLNLADFVIQRGFYAES